MVKDGFAKAGEGYQPFPWKLPRGPADHPVLRCGTELGPGFSGGGYGVNFIVYMLFFGENMLISFQNVKEVYRLRYDPRDAANGLSGATKICSTELMQGSDVVNGRQVNNVSIFSSMAGALMEKRIALSNAEAELLLAGKNIQVAACALVAMYGQDIASGKPDSIVELNICGTRMTTLRSKLQASPESALAARFDDNKKCSVDVKDFGAIDCNPAIFAKVLDVLGLRKRAMWSQQKEADIVKVFRVVITASDCASFEEFVDMYFPSCKAFVMDCASFQDF